MPLYNFSAGPSILPQSVFRQASEAVIDFNDKRLSLLEISHRSKDFVSVLDEAVARVSRILKLPENYKVLFLTGGASSQFFMTAMNLLNHDQKAAYVDTGSWSSKAIKEAKLFGQINVLASSSDQNYNYIPEGWTVPKDSVYLHITSNNTIYGTQYHFMPETEVPIVCDMSSDIFSRPIDAERFGLIYAGAQKNLGPAGVTLVIVNEEILGKVNREIPTMLDYRTHIKKNSSFNTPPVFPIYVSMLTLRWIEEQGGVEAIEKINESKAKTLYAEIDRNSKFEAVVPNPDHRSLMNVTFKGTDEETEARFLEFAANEFNCVALKGHRSVGGIRASIYNAMSQEGVDQLVKAMQEFE